MEELNRGGIRLITALWLNMGADMTGTIDISATLPITYFLSGMYMAVFAASGLVFIKFWTKSREGFFLYFGLACWMLAVERIPLLFWDVRTESYSLCYLFRLTAFCLILTAFFRANNRKKTAP